MDVQEIYNCFLEKDIRFFTGVPDSLLKDICFYIEDNTDRQNHIIAANEGNAVGIALGYYLSTGKVPLVYFQNSGLGNCINPLLSLADKEVYGIPMIMMIGWRGEPNVKDEPQHVKQGRVQNQMLESMEIPYEVIDSHTERIDIVIEKLKNKAMAESKPVALIVRKGTFSEYKLISSTPNSYSMTREKAIKLILKNIPVESILISTTGMTSREVFEHRVSENQIHDKDFLTVGGMGHCSSIALGVSLNTKRPTICLDGDGAALMHLGSLPIIGQYANHNFLHILLNNGAHDSVGGQNTIAFDVNFQKIALASGYKEVIIVDNEIDLVGAVKAIDYEKGPYLIEIRIKKGARKDLGRPTKSPDENKKSFMNFLN